LKAVPLPFDIAVDRRMRGKVSDRVEHGISILTKVIRVVMTNLAAHFAAAVGARHRGEVRGAFQANRDVTAFGKRLEVAPRSAAEIEYREGRFVLNEPQQRCDVLADVVIARAFPEILRTLVVVSQREVGDFFQILLIQLHGLHARSEIRRRVQLPPQLSTLALVDVQSSDSGFRAAASGRAVKRSR
jgi:hypothetical protein